MNLVVGCLFWLGCCCVFVFVVDYVCLLVFDFGFDLVSWYFVIAFVYLIVCWLRVFFLGLVVGVVSFNCLFDLFAFD